MRILHLTHTDIRYDSRILKELEAVSKIDKTKVKAFGVFDYGLTGFLDTSSKSGFVNINVISSRLIRFSKSIMFVFLMIEISIRFFCKGIFYRPKVIHCHDTLVLPVGVFLSIFFNSKLIYDAHELESQKNGQSKVLSKATLFIEKISWRFVDLFITVSPSIIDWYQKNLGDKESLLILNSPQLKLENFDVRSNNYLREKFNIPGNCKIFIYIGIIGKGRGIDLYLNIFKSPDINSHIVFIGYGDDVAKIQRASLNSEKIHYHTVVNHDEVVKIAKSADVGLAMIEAVSLSDYYCLPNKLFEYAFSGLFILTSDFPDMKNIIQDFDLGACSSLKIDDIKQKIIEIEAKVIKLTTKDLYTLSWQFQSEKLIEFYNNLLKN